MAELTVSCPKSGSGTTGSGIGLETPDVDSINTVTGTVTLAGADGITVVDDTIDSDTPVLTVSGFKTEFVAASGSLQTQISGIDSSVTLQDAYDNGDGTIGTTIAKPLELIGDGVFTAVTGTFAAGVTVGDSTTFLYPDEIRTGNVTATGIITIDNSNGYLRWNDQFQAGTVSTTGHWYLWNIQTPDITPPNSIVIASGNAVLGARTSAGISIGPDGNVWILPPTASGAEPASLHEFQVTGSSLIEQDLEVGNTLTAVTGTFTESLTVSGIPVDLGNSVTVGEDEVAFGGSGGTVISAESLRFEVEEPALLLVGSGADSAGIIRATDAGILISSDLPTGPSNATSAAIRFQHAGDTQFVVLSSRKLNPNTTDTVNSFDLADWTTTPLPKNRIVVVTGTEGLVDNQVWLAGDGNTGLNTTAPEERLHVVGSGILEGDLIIRSRAGGTALNLEDSGGNIFVEVGDNYRHLLVKNNGAYAIVDKLGTPAVYNRLVIASGVPNLTNVTLAQLALSENGNVFIRPRPDHGLVPVAQQALHVIGSGLFEGGDVIVPSGSVTAVTGTIEESLTVSGIPVEINGIKAHGNLTGLTTGDDHTQYALLAGRAGGQTLIGGTGATDRLSLQTNTTNTPSASMRSISINSPVLLNYPGTYSGGFPDHGLGNFIQVSGTIDALGLNGLSIGGFSFNPIVRQDTQQTFSAMPTFTSEMIVREEGSGTAHSGFLLSTFSAAPKIRISANGAVRNWSGGPTGGLSYFAGYTSEPSAARTTGFTGTITIDSMYGFQTNIDFGGFRALVPQIGLGVTVTEYVHFQAGSGGNHLLVNGTLTTEYGIRLENISRGATNISLWSDSAATMRHAGAVAIGSTTAPTFTLDVTGTGRFTSTMQNQGQVRWTSSTLSLTGNVNNQNPGTAPVLVITPNANGRTITGFSGGVAGRLLTLICSAGGAFSFSLAHQSTSSTAANRMVLPTSGTMTFTPGQSITLWYETVRWDVISTTTNS